MHYLHRSPPSPRTEGGAARQAPRGPYTLGKNAALPQDLDTALNAPESVVLYSVDPYRLARTNKTLLEGAVGSVRLSDAEIPPTIKIVKAAITDFKHGYMCLCWAPRHVLTLTAGGNVFEFVFSDMSSEIDISKNSKSYISVNAENVQPTLDALFRAHGIPVVPLKPLR